MKRKQIFIFLEKITRHIQKEKLKNYGRKKVNNTSSLVVEVVPVVVNELW